MNKDYLLLLLLNVIALLNPFKSTLTSKNEKKVCSQDE